MIENSFKGITVISEKQIYNNTFIEDLEIHYIELRKFNFDKGINDLNDLEEWIVFLKECSPTGDIEIVEKLSKSKEEISVAVDIMNKLSADELEYQRYLAREKYLMDEMSKKKYAEFRINQAEEKARMAEDKAKDAEDKAKEAENKRRNMLIGMLALKLSEIPKVYQDKIMGLSEEKVDLISNNIMNVDKIEDLDKYL